MPVATSRCAAAGLLLLAVISCGGTPSSPRPAGGPAAGRPVTSSPPRLVGRARWSHPAEGYRLHVTPTRAGRNRAASLPTAALAQAIRRAGRPPIPLTATVRDSLLSQLRCHAVFAQRKPRWNLEAWRPDVGYLATVAAACNPDA